MQKKGRAGQRTEPAGAGSPPEPQARWSGRCVRGGVLGGQCILSPGDSVHRALNTGTSLSP